MAQLGRAFALGAKSREFKSFYLDQYNKESYMYKRNKYGNKWVTIDNIKFQSKRESQQYLLLKDRQSKGEISNLVLQPRYLLQDKFTDANLKKHRKIEYVADFEYTENNETIVEDVKGVKTDVFKIKEKLFCFKYPDLKFKIIK